MKQPRNLQIGDTIGIISTARKISKEELQPALSILKKWGLKVEFGVNLFKEEHQFAGSDQDRTADLQEMLNRKDINAILCARGGYGTVRIIDQIDFSTFAKNPKWVVGYSDVTVLHSHIQQNFGIETLHATMPINFPKDGKENTALNSLKSALFTGKTSYKLPPQDFNLLGETYAPIVGGNLSILYSLLGSPSDIATDGKILFMEDLDEYLYHIDRMMMNLKRNGKFRHVAGILIGGMSDMNDNAIPFGKDAKSIINEYLKDLQIPVAFGFPAGHIDDNRALILGRKTHFKVDEEGLAFEQ